MKTEVLSLAYDPHRKAVRQAKAEGRYVYIGRIYLHRPKGQRNWGNYAPDGKVEKNAPDIVAEHKRAVAAFEKWLPTKPSLTTNVAELRGKVLVCHCKGMPCHGEVLKKLAEGPKKRGRPLSDKGKWQRDRAKELGVSLRTVQRWEKDRQAISEDPQLANLARSNVDGLKQAKKAIRQRQKAMSRPEDTAKAMLYALRKWEDLEDSEVEAVRRHLLQVDFLDRLEGQWRRGN